MIHEDHDLNTADIQTVCITVIYFLSKYTNWPYNIEEWQIYPEVVEYINDPVAYWRKYNRHHPLIAENAYDPETGGYGNGYKYNYNFSKLGLDSWYADKVGFTQLIGTPVAGVIDYQRESQRNKDIKLFNELLQNRNHLKFLRQLLFEAEDKIIFISRSVYNILRARQCELFGFKNPVLVSTFPNDDYEFRILYAHDNSYLISAQIFSSITDEGYYPIYRMLIDSILKETKCAWKLNIPGMPLPQRMEGSFHELMEQIKEKELLGSPVGISLSPFSIIPHYKYQIPALAEFFSNQRDARSIHCLIHSDTSIKIKKERLPGIWEMFNSISNLLEPENSKLIKACLLESSDKIAANDNTIPSQSEKLRDAYYYFCFRDLPQMPFTVPDDYFFVERELLTQIWITVLHNLDRHGKRDQLRMKSSMSDDESELFITIMDIKKFDFDRFIRRDSSLQLYLKINRFGSLTIDSACTSWCSTNPYNLAESEAVTGTRITFRFVLKENE